MTGTPLRVGIIGGGAVTQAIHLPTLARLTDLFTITRIADIDAAVAAEVAGRVGATASTDPMALIADPDVDVVAVGSPHPFHAAQVIAACESGKRAVLCEKPLCVTLDEAEAIRDASRRTGVPVLTATMHLFDPAFAAASAAWPAEAVPHFVASTCFLPPNGEFVDQATQLFMNPSAAGRQPQTSDRAERMSGAVLGLASHHLPLVRRFLPEIDAVTVASPVQPFGYDVTLVGGDTIGRLLGVMPATPVPSWTFEAVSDRARLTVAFPPSYVQAGSSTARLTVDGATREWSFPDSGYVEEWRLLARLASTEEEASSYMDAAVHDFTFASRILEGFAELESVAA